MRKILFLLTALCLIFSLSATAAAQQDFVVDEAGILSETEEAVLEQLAAEISARHGVGVHIRVVSNYRVLYVGDVAETAEYLFLSDNMGMGSNKDGILLFMSMDDREYHLATHGYGITAFTDFGLMKLEDQFLDDFADNDWYGGFFDYLSDCDELLGLARGGEPYDIDTDSGTKIGAVIASLMLGCIVAAVVCLIMRSGMRSVCTKGEANHYVSGSEITHRSDRLIHISRIRKKIETSSSSGRSGGSSTRSSGFGGRSGKF